MSNILVVIARPESPKSRTLKVLKVFMDEYVKTHPEDKIQTLDLYQTHFQEIDGELLSAWDMLENGTSFADLSSVQQTKVTEFNDATDQFLASDKVIIANPLVNLMIPTKLKAWIDSITVAGKTFKYTETGAIPLTQGKKVMHIQAAGGKYNNQDFGTQYVKEILGFIGVQSVEKLSVEGMDHFPDQADQIVENAKIEAKRMADEF
ncbi:FMN-dependent NADH-azoreductase [Lentilactobacillus sunkii]|jgi:FMN-dependent NADH-azoreductase|uniref:FMN dependent NADH:quinone oxidoreductase n=1 Tax=Lentilactobacillus sunkii TaxID=481719 RepID=A0A1E7XDN7_9LACO|nr:NAD(P)H-dependent oxidoreductase [Lentilactobacillus sunkii]OFA11233.1 FMN-dependent NADH-azoreductase [Lentilactobacillus sunkii]